MTATETLIRDYYAAFNRGDMAQFIAMLDDGVVHDINQGAREVGKKAFEAFMKKMNHHYKEEVVDLVVMVDSTGSRAAAEFRILGTYLKTDAGLPEARGQRYDLPVGAFFEIKNGKVARITNYYNLQDWSAQVEK